MEPSVISRIEDIKRPLELGEQVLVPHVINNDSMKEDYEYINGELTQIYWRERDLVPIHLTLHSDKENGQNEQHYHYDSRFNIYREGGRYNEVEEIDMTKGLSRLYEINLRPLYTKNIIYIPRKVVRVGKESQWMTTQTSFISKSKLKHKCIHKGKCPHRGHDLSQVESIDGVITCPLHGLEFDSKTKKLLNNPNI